MRWTSFTSKRRGTTFAFAGLAGLYLQLDAQFVGLVQVLVYVGAVAILIVFAILLTPGSESTESGLSKSSFWGFAASGIVAVALIAALLRNRTLSPTPAGPADVKVKDIGNALMTDYVLPLEVIGLLLTAALIGAVIIAMAPGKRERTKS